MTTISELTQPKLKGPRRIVWAQTEPVRVRVMGDAGTGVSFVLWNLATLCNVRELPAAVVESDRHPLALWTDVECGIHVYDEVPAKGYRVVLSSRDQDAHRAHVTVVVTLPDVYRVERLQLRLLREGVSPSETIWIVNHAIPGVPLPITLDAPVVCIPHDVRQWGAVRLKQPLCQLDPAFATLFEPIPSLLSEMYLAHAKGGTMPHVDSTRV